MDVKDAFSFKKKHRHTKLQKSTQRVYLLYGGGTMRNSHGEIDILVSFKSISHKTLYMNIHTTTRKSRGGVPRCNYIFQGDTEC